MKSLRPYQILAIEALKRDLEKDCKHLLVLPTGSGKTYTISSFLKNFKSKFLFIAHTREILNQSHKQFSNDLDPNLFTTLTPQAVLKNIDSLKKQKYKFIIFDECHRAAAKSYLKIIENFNSQSIHFIGLTATPFRTDKKSIYKIFGLPCFSVSIIDLINENYLCDFKGYRIRTNTSLKGISTQNGDFAPGKLAAVINVKNRNEIILNEYKKLDPKNKTLCFCCTVAHATDLNKIFIDAGFNSAIVHGKLKTNHRNRIINDFKLGKLRILFSCQILTEGFDEPSIDTLFLCRPTVSKTLYMQMIGRGARLFPTKTYCDVYEFTDNDYDVCSLEDLIDSPVKKLKIENSEKITSYARRVKELEDEGVEILKEEINLIKKHNFYEKPATEWQINQLTKMGKKFKLPISEHSANILLWS